MLTGVFYRLAKSVYQTVYQREVIMASINKLSDAYLRSIHNKPYSGMAVVSDGLGLTIRVSPKGHISWLYRYRLCGYNSNPQSIRLGNYPEISLKQAREIRDLYRSWVMNGNDPKIELKMKLQKQLTPVTVKDALEYWLVEYAQSHRKNVSKNCAQFNRHIYPYIGDLPLERVETIHWLECFERISQGIAKKRQPAPVAAGQVLQATKQALVFCRKRGYAISHALDDLTISDVGKKEAKRDRVLTDVELQDVSNFCDLDSTPLYYQRLIKLLIVFGARTQKVRLSQWHEWDFDKGLWTVPKSNSKTSEKITRPIPDELRSWLLGLKAQTQKSGYILGSLKKAENVSQYGRKLWIKFGHKEKWTLHDLRRTMATKLNDLGVLPHIVEHLLGHSVAGVAGIYNRSEYVLEKTKALKCWLYFLDRGKILIQRDCYKS